MSLSVISFEICYYNFRSRRAKFEELSKNTSVFCKKKTRKRMNIDCVTHTTHNIIKPPNIHIIRVAVGQFPKNSSLSLFSQPFTPLVFEIYDYKSTRNIFFYSHSLALMVFDTFTFSPEKKSFQCQWRCCLSDGKWNWIHSNREIVDNQKATNFFDSQIVSRIVDLCKLLT